MLKLVVPFCGSKCSFCDLPVFSDSRLTAIYTLALQKEMRMLRARVRDRRFFSFRAEGNMLALDAARLDGVLAAVFSGFKFTEGHKSGIEMNPAAVTKEKLGIAAAHGVQWAILGVQSLDDAVLAAAGCPHRGGDIENKYGIIRNSGVKSVSMDLMYGLPGQTKESFIRDVLRLVKMRPERLAVYRYSVLLKNRKEADYLVKKSLEIMEKAGYLFRKDHDPYWGVLDFGLDATWPHAYETGTPVNAYSVLSLGAGAKSYLWGRGRYRNTKDPLAYIKSLGAGRLPADLGCELSVYDEMVNYMLLSFDCVREIPEADFRLKFGAGLEETFGRQLKALCASGVIGRAPGGYRVLRDHDAARHAARKAFFPGKLVEILNGEQRARG
jgi:oxygen-independent coproporphyrinogen-3 oxidase